PPSVRWAHCGSAILHRRHWLDDPSSPPLASESWTLPRSSDPAAPPRLLAPS
ncbi:hypothetical protein M9458_005382, partial [Cirrhinus mrigala]